MSFQAYLDNIKAKTGKTPADFAKLAAKRKLTSHGPIVAWLKDEFALGHGHATAIATVLLKSEARAAGPDRALDTLFIGKKGAWRAAADGLFAKLAKLGPDVAIAPNATYINLMRGSRKFGIVQATATALDIGIKRKGVAPEGRFIAAGTWNAMVTHRVRITDGKQLDAEVLRWLKAAYATAG